MRTQGAPHQSPALVVQVLIPVFNDWESLWLLLPELAKAAAQAELEVEVVVVDDGSTQVPKEPPPQLPQLGSVRLLRLRRNLGHQRAIAIGLAQIATHMPCECVVIMDGDGEDSPHDVPRLVQRMRETGSREIVFAERTRRSESLQFRFFYASFRLAHWLLTGRGVRFGNFSAIPASLLPTFLVLSELWNHYAAAAVRARLPFSALPTARRTRLRGRSQMNFASLVTHGLSAISVFADVVATRALIAVGLLMGLGALVVMAALWIRFGTDWAIPGWTTNVIAFVVILIVQAITACFVLTIFTLQSRTQLGFLPSRDFELFVAELRQFRCGASRESAPPPC
jgi:polyisoprenyl-phosphate glycosyltransferase